MDEKYTDYNGGSGKRAGNLKIYLSISWISAAITAFVTPYFVVAGITFGMLANRISAGSGNAALITNIVVAAFNFIFWLLLEFSLNRIFI